MADLDDYTLRRQGMADAVVALVLSRQLPRHTAEDLGQWIGLRQRDVLDAVARLKNGDQLVVQIMGGRPEARTPNGIRAEIDALRLELKAAEKAARDAVRHAAREAREAERAAAVQARADARAAEKAARDAQRAEAKAARRAQMPADRAARAELRSLPEAERRARLVELYPDGPDCSECGVRCKDARGLHAHSLIHETAECPTCGKTVIKRGLGPHRKHCEGATDAA